MKDNYKKGVDFVFEEHPELSNIGTQEQYSKYLKTIFPESKVKDIVYHGSKSKEITKFLKLGEEGFKSKSRSGAAGIYFTNSLQNAKRFFNVGSLFKGKGRVYPVVVDLKNPDSGKRKCYFSKRDTDYVKWVHEITDSEYKELLSHNKDGMDFIVREKRGKPIREIIALEPSQIHILGSKKDLKEFEKHVKINSEKSQKGTSLEDKIISGIFILSFLTGIFFLSPNITGNVIGTLKTSQNLLGLILALSGVVGFFIYKKSKNKKK